MKQKINIAMIGGGFMGKAHSSAWQRVAQFFELPVTPVLKVVVGSKTPLESFARSFGYEEVTYDWRSLLTRDDIDVVDIATPPYMHKEMVLAFAARGVHIVCEKPFTLGVDDAKCMLAAAKKANIVHYLNHNYRRIPAVMYAKQLIDEGRLGKIYHWRGAYLQDWIMSPTFPLSWHLQKEFAGGGASYDIACHAIDLARYLAGDILAVTSVNKTFIHKRPLPAKNAGPFRTEGAPTSNEMGDVTVDDASFSLVEFQNGALGSIEATRFAAGMKNANLFEIYGEKGAIAFDLERMNELLFFDATQPLAEQGFRRILATEAAHPYIAAWWPPGHSIGYEHTFVHAFYDFLNAVASGGHISPNFEDGLEETRILQAILQSGEQRRRVEIAEMK
ncbi:Gfo/Idh/MocA family oxidoreductase [Christensenellaceae bacterium OttesenSCG-928-L17]|nr:Gfo/Idh/MocA family oxidoreductase [Christensenellaceae bacterium OttesenSCG-928-L17]